MAAQKADLLITNARLFCPASQLDKLGWLAVSDGRIAGLGAGQPDKQQKAAQIFDGGGQLLLPGLVDMRVQASDPGAEHLESLEALLQAAAAGGITSLATLPDTLPVIDNSAMIDSISLRASRLGGPRLFCLGAMTQGLGGQRMAELGMMAEAGARGFASHLTSVADSQLMRRIMTYAAMLERPVIHHCADPALSAEGEMQEGETATRLGLIGIPAAAETIILERDLALVRLTGAAYHAGHISTAGSVAALRRAKQEGLKVTADTAPPWFLLNEMAVPGFDTAFRLDPPLRTEQDRLAVIDGLADGTIDAIASDHRAINPDHKKQPFGMASPGAAGIETLLPLSLALVSAGALSLERMVQCLTAGPAAILGLETGQLAVGKPADMIVLDSQTGWVIRSADFVTPSLSTPFEGQPVQGRVLASWVGGAQIFSYQNGPQR